VDATEATVNEQTTGTAGFWRAAYAAHGTVVLAFLRSRLRRREDAEELLHDTFVRAIKASGALRDAGKVRAYLLSIAHRQLLNHHRRRGIALFSEQDEAFAEALAENADIAGESPDAPVAERELGAHLEAGLRNLPAGLRLAFELGAVQKLPYAEIAARTGWSLALVKVNVYRARKRLIAGLAAVVPELAGSERQV
jgi:RNA polymerase sigma factor (sigma-70 family)